MLLPLMVERSRLVRALEGMRTKIVALCLNEVCPELSAAQCIDVLHGGRECGDGHAVLHSKADDTAQTLHVRIDGGEEEVIEHEILEIRLALIGIRDALQKFRLDDAARTEDGGNLSEVK